MNEIGVWIEFSIFAVVILFGMFSFAANILTAVLSDDDMEEAGVKGDKQ